MSNLGGEVRGPGKNVDKVQLTGGVHQGLLLVLAMNVQERQREFLQRGDRGRLTVNEYTIAAIARNLAADDEFTVFRVKAKALEFNIEVGIEHSFNNRARFSGADGICRRLRAGNETQRIYNQGLSGSGFARQQIQSVVKVDFQVI